jgi:hypothetical protein
VEARAKIDNWHRAAAAEGRVTTTTTAAAAAAVTLSPGSIPIAEFGRIAQRVLDLERRNTDLAHRLAAADARVALGVAEAKVASARILDLEAKLLRSVVAPPVVTDVRDDGDFHGG